MKVSDFGMDTVTLAGTLDEKLRAVAGAGFSKVMLWARDLVNDPEGLDASIQRVKKSGLEINGFQLLRDFEGLPDPLLEFKLHVARGLLDLMKAVGGKLLQVPSSTSPHATADPERIARDLIALSELAAPYGVRIGYEALAWGRKVNENPAAWEAVKLANRDNVGLVVDSFHIISKGTSFEHLAAIPPEKIFLVQLADYVWALDTIIETARGRRVFVGEGIHNDEVMDIVRRLDRAGYRGDYVFEVFNEDYLQLPLPVVAMRARKSAEWVCEQASRGRI
jgi:2-keto-myo-inositol isomerase